MDRNVGDILCIIWYTRSATAGRVLAHRRRERVSGERVVMSQRHRFLGMLMAHRSCVVGQPMSSAHIWGGGRKTGP